MRLSYLAAAILFCALRGVSPAAAQELTPQGVWLHDNKRIGVEVGRCGAELCGRIVWLKSPNDDTGKPRTDAKNPDPSLRGRSVLGLIVISGLVRDEKGNWSDGTIYNPHDGNTYGAEITVVDPDRLEVRAYTLLPAFGKTLVWTRLRNPELAELNDLP